MTGTALLWSTVLLGTVVFIRRYLGWVMFPGLWLDASGWRQLLQQKLFPVFTAYFAAAGEPAHMAAEHAAAAAAARAANISYCAAFVALVGTLILLLAFCCKSWWKYYWRF